MWLSLLAGAPVAEARSLGLWKAVKHTLGSLRTLIHPERSRRAEEALNRLEARRWLPMRERHFYIRHNFYLSKLLSIRQRIDSCWHHYTHEAERFGARYRDQVYGGAGLVLWQETVEGHSFAIRLTASTEMRREGDLSLQMLVDNAPIHVMSCAYVDAGLFGQPGGSIMFITRNQALDKEAEQGIFRSAFRQTVPPYFCLAAATGVALAQGMRRVAAIRHEAQIACTADIIAGLRNSYDGFWRAFKGTAIDAQAFVLPVPLEMTPMCDLNSKHRRRARDRREAWAAVAHSAQAVVAAELRSGGAAIAPAWLAGTSRSA